ncbi:MAG: nucleotidyltransferase family protein [Chloroflexi bacterium]|nr:nucleotidyltransferase family protein [Chloroflexota bacterium]
MRALVLAAGEGQRLRPLTLHMPKPMVPVGGRPVLEHSIGLLRRHGITEIAINLHYRPDAIVEYFGDGRRFGVSLTYSHEARLLGSAGAARALDTFLTDGFLVIYGDVLTDVDLSALVARHRETGAAGTIGLYEVSDPSRCGIVELDASGRVTRFVEKPAPGTISGNLANSGILVLEPSVLRDVPPDEPYDFGLHLFPKLLDRGEPLYGERLDGYILDIGSRDRLEQAEADYRAGRFRSALRDAGAAPTEGASC